MSGTGLVAHNWSEVFSRLPELLPELQLIQRNHRRYESCIGIDGYIPEKRRADATAAVLNNDGIMLIDNRKNAPQRFTPLVMYICDRDGIRPRQAHLAIENKCYRSGRNSHVVRSDRAQRNPPQLVQEKPPVQLGDCTPIHPDGVGAAYLRSRGLDVDILQLNSIYDSFVPVGASPDRLLIGDEERTVFRTWEPCLAYHWTGHDGSSGGYSLAIPNYNSRGDYNGTASKSFLRGNGAAQTNTVGGAVRVSHQIGDGVVAVCEGVEDAIALMLMNGRYDTQPAATCRTYGLPEQFAAVPVWATLSCTNLQHFTPPAGVHTVWVCEDSNEDGEKYARKLIDRLRNSGYRVGRIATGHGNIDYNDKYNGIRNGKRNTRI